MNERKTTDQRALDLLNGGIDGGWSAAEREELSGVLAASSDAREVNEELKSLAQLMTDLPDLEPPQYLQESIERQIRLPVESKAEGGTLGFFGNWWSSTEVGSSSAWARRLSYNDLEVYRFYIYKSNGFSIRCLKD